MTGGNKKSRKGMFARIKTRDDGLKTIKETSIAFLIIAGIQAAGGYFLAPSMIVDAVLFAALGLILLKWKARTAAIPLAILSGILVVVTILNKLGVISEGGTNIFLALIVFYAAIRAVETTFKLHGKFAEKGI
jgi:hypothetical protein